MCKIERKPAIADMRYLHMNTQSGGHCAVNLPDIYMMFVSTRVTLSVQGSNINTRTGGDYNKIDVILWGKYTVVLSSVCQVAYFLIFEICKFIFLSFVAGNCSRNFQLQMKEKYGNSAESTWYHAVAGQKNACNIDAVQNCRAKLKGSSFLLFK